MVANYFDYFVFLSMLYLIDDLNLDFCIRLQRVPILFVLIPIPIHEFVAMQHLMDQVDQAVHRFVVAVQLYQYDLQDYYV